MPRNLPTPDLAPGNREKVPMTVAQIHHVAYRCRDAQETVDFYSGKMGMPYVMAVAEDRVPSTKEECPYMHIFFDAGQGSCLAFFEVPESPPATADPNTPEWVQHIAFRVDTMDDLQAKKTALLEAGCDVIGPTNHEFCQSIYAFDPNGHRIEFAVDTSTPEMMDKLKAMAGPMLAEWNKTKRAPKMAAFVHEKELEGA
jgi:lactoylglutathione lyase